MHYEYKPKGVCPSQISFDLNQGIVSNVSYTGGCSGNLQALPILVEGLSAEAIIAKLEGVRCDSRPTSCAAQLAEGLKKALAETPQD